MSVSLRTKNGTRQTSDMSFGKVGGSVAAVPERSPAGAAPLGALRVARIRDVESTLEVASGAELEAGEHQHDANWDEPEVGGARYQERDCAYYAEWYEGGEIGELEPEAPVSSIEDADRQHSTPLLRAHNIMASLPVSYGKLYEHLVPIVERPAVPVVHAIWDNDELAA
ncbi:hypothetical protein BDK51DRAFT_32450 [Blyttiomyces helicus]|uniref:Uncharacterized protein n=1 Tax=Blyttiomyces helicus TaxID=388810 RepID=A0A4V1IQ49_9FUNG|nr:hypothetical protein BDK51DRAFT_32450 [Blyttiomyces helicus]|eukprot:RKO85317.1 hypothetical protein BDK51DRAFT_32450 [Blyttiomyces helicus]